MALKLSTGLRNALLGYCPSVTSSGLSGTSGTKTIADSGNGLAVFLPGDIVTISTALVASGYATVSTVATTGASLVVTDTVLDQAAGSEYTLTLANSRGLADALRHGVLDIYSGSQPSDADSAETGTKLVRITVSSGAFTAGAATNGLDFDAPSAGTISKAAAEVWSGVGLAMGTAGWWRLYSNLATTGSSSTAIRMDGTCGTSGTQITMSSTAITSGATITIDTFSITLPAS